jgi:hypothetical protein
MVYGLVWFQEHIPKRRVLDKDWISCLEYDHHSRLNNQHDLGTPIWPCNERENLHFDNDLHFQYIRCSYELQNSRRKWRWPRFWNCKPSCTNHMFPYPRRSRRVGRSKVETPYHDNNLIVTPIISPQSGWQWTWSCPELHMGGFSDGGWQF